MAERQDSRDIQRFSTTIGRSAHSNRSTPSNASRARTIAACERSLRGGGVRRERKQRGEDKRWQFMVRVRIPGGRLSAALL